VCFGSQSRRRESAVGGSSSGSGNEQRQNLPVTDRETAEVLYEGHKPERAVKKQTLTNKNYATKIRKSYAIPDGGKHEDEQELEKREKES